MIDEEFRHKPARDPLMNLQDHADDAKVRAPDQADRWIRLLAVEALAGLDRWRYRKGARGASTRQA